MIRRPQGFLFALLIGFCSTAIATSAPAPVTINTPATSHESYADKVSDTTGTDDAAQSADAKDPYEGLNRAIFTFNDKIDQFIMKPIARFYNAIMPKPLNQGVHNFYNNIGTLPTLANDLLQFNFYQAANDSWRIIINTTVGVGGLFDVATRINLKYYSNDFGLTLASWGYEKSNYLVLPFFGPSTPRDGIGIPVDYFAFSIYPYIYPQSTRYQVYGLSIVDRRAQILKFQDVLEEASVDRYVFMRNAYMQHRAHQIEENQHLSYSDREDSQPVAEIKNQ